jgi:YVTN family beta-propeller protein
MKMSRLKRCIVFLSAVLIGGCVPLESDFDVSVPKMPLGPNGEVILYLQPLPPEADKLRFEIGGITAVKDDGSAVPLSLVLTELRGANLTGLQKLLANGVLVPGHYTGISVQIKRAWVETAEGEAALEVSEEPLGVAQPFDVARQKATALFLTLNPGRQIRGENQFAPVFSLASAGRLLINLTALVSNPESNIITIFNKQTMQVADVIAAGQGPMGLALNRLRSLVYAAVARDDAILAIDVFKRQIVNRLKLNFRDNPVDVVLTPDGRRLVAVNHDSNTVSLIDAFSLTEEKRIRVGEGPAAAVMDPSGTRVFILNTRSRSISVVDLSQNTLAVTIGVEASPLRGTFNREGNLLFVISGDSPYLTAVDRSRLAVAQKIFVGSGAVSIKADNQTGLLYVGRKSGGEIAVIEPSSSMFVDTFQVGGRAVFLAIDEQERSLFAALSDRNILQKINLVSKKVVAEIDVGKGAYAIVVMGER